MRRPYPNSWNKGRSHLSRVIVVPGSVSGNISIAELKLFHEAKSFPHDWLIASLKVPFSGR